MRKRQIEWLPMIPDRELARSLMVGLVAAVGTTSLAVVVGINPKFPLLLRLALLLPALFTCSFLPHCWTLAHWLRIQRLARPVLSLLANPNPDPMDGPWLLPSGDSVAWRVIPEADGKVWAVFNLMRYEAASGLKLCAGVRGTHGEPPPPAAICRGLLRQLLPAHWHQVTDENGPTPVRPFWCAPQQSTPVVLEDPTRGELSTERSEFLRPVFEVPEPITFPREPFVEELEQHRALVREHIDGLWFQVRLPADDLDDVPFSTVRNIGEILVVGTNVQSAHVLGRVDLAARYEKQLGIRRRLQSHAESRCLEVIINGDSLVSLHLTRLRETHGPKDTVSRRFELDESAPVIIEPTRQEHARWRGKTVVYWQAKAGAEIHRAETTAPEAASSIAEAVDRQVAYRHEEVRRAAWESWDLGSGFVLVSVNRLSGDSVLQADHVSAARFGVLEGFPGIRRAVALHQDYKSWFPVVVHGVRYAGLRWIPMRAGLDEASRPPNFDEVLTRGHLRVVDGSAADAPSRTPDEQKPADVDPSHDPVSGLRGLRAAEETVAPEERPCNLEDNDR
jgi:hypothetical protein